MVVKKLITCVACLLYRSKLYLQCSLVYSEVWLMRWEWSEGLLAEQVENAVRCP